MIKLITMFWDEVVAEATTGSVPVRIANVSLGVLVAGIAIWIGYHVANDILAVL